MARTFTILGSAFLLTAAIFAASLLPVGERPLGPVENIHGIPYPKQDSTVIVTEPLAHADIDLHEPVLAKQLELTVSYRPVNLTSLAVGVREDSFWLSYGSRQEIFHAGNTPGVELDSSPGVKEARIKIPLTDKLQETDRSLDLMFFAEPLPAPRSPLGEVGWELHELKARVTYAKPAHTQFRNYVGSILKRERAL